MVEACEHHHPAPHRTVDNVVIAHFTGIAQEHVLHLVKGKPVGGAAPR